MESITNASPWSASNLSRCLWIGLKRTNVVINAIIDPKNARKANSFLSVKVGISNINPVNSSRYPSNIREPIVSDFFLLHNMGFKSRVPRPISEIAKNARSGHVYQSI